MTQLLPREALIPTGPVDRADWNYRPVLGWIQRQRFRLVRKLLPAQRIGRLLEIGYGSGVFLPELALCCDELHGIDIHPHSQAVQNRLAEFGVQTRLVSGSAEGLPYEDAYFDAIVAVSSLEFVLDISAAVGEIRRVLKPAGCLVVVTPGQSWLIDRGLTLLTGESAKHNYADRRAALMPALLQQFSIESRRTFPRALNRVVCLYNALRLRPQPIAAEF